MRSRYVIGAVLLVVLLGSGFVLSQRTPARPATLERVVIAANTEYVGTCAIMAAKHEGYFEDEQLAVTVQPHSTGKSAMQSMLQGRADLATVAEIPVMLAALSGTPVRVVATLFHTQSDHGIVARRDRGIDGPSSLKGRRVGYTQGTSGHFALDVFLNRQRQSVSDVTLTSYAPERLADALERGEIDAVASWEPFLSESREKLGDMAVSFTSEETYESIYNIIGMQAYLRSRPDTVRRMLRALMQGSRFCRENPDAMRPLLAPTAKMNREAVLAAWPAYRFEVDLDQGLLLALEDRARWAIRNGIASGQMPNFLDYVYLDGLVAVQPSAVTIIH
jgi:NitT/TauT family transport system substrate-binding protein